MDQKGQSYVEILIAVVILAIVIIGLLNGVFAGIKATGAVDQGTTAINIARSQMEYIKSQDYSSSYIKLDDSDLPDGWTNSQITIDVVDVLVSYLQRITVTVSYGDGKSVIVEDYKANR